MVKFLLMLKPFVNSSTDRKAKYCSTCGSYATQEAWFDVGEGITIIEKYCNMCAQKAMR